MEGKIKQQGMSLVELLVAMAILGIALVPLLGVFSHALKMTEHANKRTIALDLLRDLQEEVRSKPFWEPYPTGGKNIYFPNTTTRQPFGCEECKTTKFVASATVTRYQTFDDLDDYDGWCEGRDCNVSYNATCTADAIAWGLCGTNVNRILTAYNGTPYSGRGYPHYQDYTRTVTVYNIWENVSTVKGREPRLHNMSLGVGDYRKQSPFSFYDLREERGFKNLTSDPRKGRAQGKTSLKMVIVKVSYSGTFTPTFTVEDRALMAAPIN